eukprot:gene21052-27928_t
MAMIALGSFLALIGGVLFIYCMCACCQNRKKDKVAAGAGAGAGAEVNMAKAKSSQEADVGKLKSAPKPDYPTITMATKAPHELKFVIGPKQDKGSPTLERLVLISSHVQDPMKLAGAVLPKVGFVVYDWMNFTGQELLQKGSETSPQKLESNKELSQLWKSLSGHVFPGTDKLPCRIDLIGCRVMEDPEAGLALLKALHALTEVQFSASDDPTTSYSLKTYLDDPKSGQPVSKDLNIKGLNLYFNVAKLRDGKDEASGAAVPAAAGQGILERFSAAVQKMVSDASKKDLQHFQAMVNLEGKGTVTLEELQTALDDARIVQKLHFVLTVNMYGKGAVPLEELQTASDDASIVQKLVEEGKGDELLEALHSYLTENDATIKDIFNKSDANKNGTLEHVEVARLISQIPGLNKDEQLFVISFLYKNDTNSDGSLSLDELKAAVASQGNKDGGTSSSGGGGAENGKGATVRSPGELPSSP